LVSSQLERGNDDQEPSHVDRLTLYKGTRGGKSVPNAKKARLGPSLLTTAWWEHALLYG